MPQKHDIEKFKNRKERVGVSVYNIHTDIQGSFIPQKCLLDYEFNLHLY